VAADELWNLESPCGWGMLYWDKNGKKEKIAKRKRKEGVGGWQLSYLKRWLTHSFFVLNSDHC
jgi:hypothetical protein